MHGFIRTSDADVALRMCVLELERERTREAQVSTEKTALVFREFYSIQKTIQITEKKPRGGFHLCA